MSKGSVLLMVALCIAAGAATEKWEHLHVTWSVLGGYHSLPTTVDEATAAGYEFMIHDAYVKADLYSYPNDPRLAILFDTYGNIGGLRTGYIKSDIVLKAEKNNLTFPSDYFTSKKMYGDTTYWDTDVYTNTVLFTSPTTMKSGGRNETNGLVADSVWFKLNNKWTEMPTAESDATSLNFTRQGCFIGLGRHYFHGMTTDVDCDDLQGVFLMYSTSGNMIGLGMAPWGSFTSGPNVTWFEDVTALETEVIVPTRPDCLTEWVNDYGLSTLHVFFSKYPRLIMC